MVYTALVCGDVGLVVRGSAWSIELALADGRRVGEATTWFASDAGLVGVDPCLEWDLHEVSRYEA